MTTAYAWMRHIRDRKDISGMTKSVAVMLGLRANKNNECHPSHARLAQDCGFGESTVRREIARLRALGLLIVIKRTGKRGQTSNMYVLIHPQSNGHKEDTGCYDIAPRVLPRGTPKGATTWHQKYIPSEVQPTTQPLAVDNAVHAYITDLAANRKP